MAQAQLVVLGGGPGGYAAAFHAARLGLEVTLVDEGARLGGVCLNRGCIPSKALLHAARVIHESEEAAEFGVSFEPPEIDLDRLRAWKREVVGKLTGGLDQLAKRNKVSVVRSRGVFRGSRELELRDGGTLAFERLILATGSLPVVPAALRVDDPRVMDSTAALDLPDVPKRLLVIGGGYIGLELSTVYAALGSRVTVVELTGELLAGVDRDLVRPLEKRLRATVQLSTEVKRLEPREEGVIAYLEGQGVDAQQMFDRVLIAAGRRPNTQGLGLERTRVELDGEGFVRADASRRTADDAVLAIGDVAGRPMLAHKAMHEGKVAAETAAGKDAVYDARAVPAVVFTDPEIAWCGLTETEAERAGRKVKVARFPWSASGRAYTLGRTEGLTKLVLDPETERVLGVGVVGAGAGELIAEGVLAIEMGAVARDVAASIHAHPTLSETVGEAADVFLGEPTHVFAARKA